MNPWTTPPPIKPRPYYYIVEVTQPLPPPSAFHLGARFTFQSKADATQAIADLHKAGGDAKLRYNPRSRQQI